MVGDNPLITPDTEREQILMAVSASFSEIAVISVIEVVSLSENARNRIVLVGWV
jgi:hypothetical protein